MPRFRRSTLLAGALAAGLTLAVAPDQLDAQERQPWQSGQSAPTGRDDGYRQQPPFDDRDAGPANAAPYRQNDGYRQSDPYRPENLPPPSGGGYRSGDAVRPADPYRRDDTSRTGGERPRQDDAYRPPSGPGQQGGGFVDNYRSGRGYAPSPPPRDDTSPGYGQPYAPPRQAGAEPYERDYGQGEPPPPPNRDSRGPGYPSNDGTYSQGEIMSAGHSFFGSISQGLASVIEHAFKQSGRPNGYILGEDAGGAFIAGLRYGEGALHTKDAGTHRIYWQGPSVGYDFGAEASKTMVLVYNLRDPSEIYNRFGGVQGSAYVVGGVGIQFQKNEDVVLAPIRAGIGLRLGANVGYLKYTRTPTWNPF